MIDRDHKLPISRQASLLNVSRGTVYYLPQPVSPAELALTRLLPGFIPLAEPIDHHALMLLGTAPMAFTSPGWTWEVKFDGFRNSPKCSTRLSSCGWIASSTASSRFLTSTDVRIGMRSDRATLCIRKPLAQSASKPARRTRNPPVDFRWNAFTGGFRESLRELSRSLRELDSHPMTILAAIDRVRPLQRRARPDGPEELSRRRPPERH